jgi:hypothetical protein
VQPPPPLLVLLLLLLLLSEGAAPLLLQRLSGRDKRLTQNRQLYSSLQHWLDPACQWHTRQHQPGQQQQQQQVAQGPVVLYWGLCSCQSP